MERISFTVLPQAAADQVTTTTGIHTADIHAAGPDPLLGPIGRMVLDNLLPTARRQHVKARSHKNPTSKYGPNAGKHPQTTQTYAHSVEIHTMEHGLASHRHRQTQRR
ncbi:hypothetical protein [Streptomyces noursei]|uniref:hypothetical protein n=1 Tax=Streptomyces noursei TaxID=1971 RepID=UPI0023B7A727|nr:hypothetical protein [Streptomyces noursei]